ncbi:MAG: hypothetical protein ONB05_09695 [candidate division KSB1 bacterium]|nr:hypothetical protein [candidate division KSB1 bacterium]
MKPQTLKRRCFFLLIWLLGSHSLLAQSGSDLETKLWADMEDYRLDNFSHIEAAFILSGATHPDSLNFYLSWYQQLLTTIKGFNFNPFDRVGSAAKVFSYLHGTWLLTYQEKATTLLNVVQQKEYNCVAGTILYNLVCQDLGWPTEAFETPTHTYTIFPNFTERVMVENTTPMGFDIMKNLKEYSRYLLKFYPEKQALKIGLDRIYAYENSKGRPIDNTELLGLLAYNRAYFAMKANDYQTAYDFVLLAQKFNKDSRSNVQFEIDLYFRWGNKLFEEGKFYDAFEVYADACYRYPDIKEFIHNCKAAFFNALQNNWQSKDWKVTQQITSEILDLEILERKDLIPLQQILQNWASYFYQIRKWEEARQVTVYLELIAPDDPQLKVFKEALKRRN